MHCLKKKGFQMGNYFFSLLLYHFYYFSGEISYKNSEFEALCTIEYRQNMNISNLKDNCWWPIVQFSLVSSAVPTFSHPSDHRFPLSEGCRVFIFCFFSHKHFFHWFSWSFGSIFGSGLFPSWCGRFGSFGG